MLMLALLCDPGQVCARRPRHCRARAPRSCHCPCAAVVVVVAVVDVVLLLCWRRPGEDWWPGRGPCPQSPICSSAISPPAASIFSTLHQISSSHQAQHPGMQTGSSDKIGQDLIRDHATITSSIFFYCIIFWLTSGWCFKDYVILEQVNNQKFNPITPLSRTC